MKRPKRVFGVRSILSLVSTGTILAYLIINMLMSNLLMERFYIRKIEKQLVAAYEVVLEHPDGDLEAMSELENDSNFRILLVSLNDNKMVYNSRWDERLVQFAQDHVKEQALDLLKKTEDAYVLSTNEGQEFTASGATIDMGNIVFLVGWVGEDQVVQISAQREPLTNAVRIASQFSMITGALLFVVTLLLYHQLSGRIVKPLEEMTRVAGEIAKLNFSHRCAEVSNNEFGQLSRSINAMSDTMQEYIAELEQANAQLRRDIEQRERNEAARRSLVDNLSHDLKTPIALISGYAEGLGSGMANTPEMVREYCDVISDESDRMLEMITRMLALSRLESGTVEPEPELFCLSDLLDDLLNLYSYKLESEGITLERSYPPECYVNCDYVSTEQVLTNYVQNAMTHLDEKKRVRVRVLPWEDYFRVEVYNTAKPIPAEQQEKLWDSFYRGETSRHRRGSETGLGLAIVRSNMELMGLPYGMENAEEGVIFWIALPPAEDTPEEEPES